MNEPRTLTLLFDCIEKEYEWRIIELSNFRSTILSTKGKPQEGMIRAGVALLYAHWEGFIKKSADLYYNFVSYQNCKLSELNDCFISIALKSELEQLQNTKKLTIQNSIINVFFEKKDSTAIFSSSSPIKTSNLKYFIFEDVCLLIGIDINIFHERYIKKGYDRNIEMTINDLVDKRNFIAHGEFLPIKEKEFTELYNIIVNGILYNFKEVIMDSAQNSLYKRK